MSNVYNSAQIGTITVNFVFYFLKSIFPLVSVHCALCAAVFSNYSIAVSYIILKVNNTGNTTGSI
jgi:hypothetical protein